MPEPKFPKAPDLDNFDKAGIDRGKGFTQTGGIYAVEHATRPSTVGTALGGCNPLSTLAWFGGFSHSDRGTS